MLRQLKQEDAPELFVLFAGDESLHFLDIPFYSLASTERFINEILASELLGLCLAKTIWLDEKLAGFILLANISQEEGSAEMGTWLGKNFRGMGINQKAKEEMLHIAFQNLHLNIVILITASHNLRSKKALTKFSYVRQNNQKYESRKKQQEFLFRTSYDIYEVSKEDFLSYLNSAP